MYFSLTFVFRLNLDNLLMKEKDEQELLEEITGSEYKYGFTSNFDVDEAPAGLNDDIIRLISHKKEEPEWLLEWRLKAFRHWKEMVEPEWANVQYDKPDFKAIKYYSAPKKKKELASLDELDPEMKATFDKLGISNTVACKSCP